MAATGSAAGFDAEAWLASLEPLGWSFGLERIEALLRLLGDPHHRFESIHVVGTNGKSSVTEMTAALLHAHGRRCGAYLSPHGRRWSERVRVGGAELAHDAFAAAAEEVAGAAATLERDRGRNDRVTQFEAATATALLGLAQAGADVAVVEAGLGGRLDATNVLSSRATVLTSIGLEHTRWLGDTVEEIALEKLAVLRDGTALVVGRLPPEVHALAARVAAERQARLLVAAAPPADVSLRTPAPYARRNLGVAMAAAGELLGSLDGGRVRAAAERLRLPGRAELLAGDPPLLLDAAHNPEGATALAEALPAIAPGRPVVGCLALLADKDAAGVIAALAPRLDAAVCTELAPEALRGSGRGGAGVHPADELARLCEAAGVAPVRVEADASSAVREAQALARERSGMALVAGSHYLLGQEWTGRRGKSSCR